MHRCICAYAYRKEAGIPPGLGHAGHEERGKLNPAQEVPMRVQRGLKHLVVLINNCRVAWAGCFTPGEVFQLFKGPYARAALS